MHSFPTDEKFRISEIFLIYNCISRITKSPRKTNTKKVGKTERSLMGNIACLFWRPGGYEDEVREGRSATVDTTISADSGFVDEATPKENSLLENLISAVRYILAKTLFNLYIID